MRARAPAALLGLLLLPAVGAAQVIDSLPPRPDSALVLDSADAFRRLQAEANVVVPVMPRMTADGPQPPLTRLVFPRDSIDAAGALTVGDVLARVPGVYLWRGGGIGRPEHANFRGRGAASLEYFLDGMPYLPVGPDSLSVDAALVPLALLERIEVERWPGLLRVHLFTRRHDRLAAGSHVVLGAGPKKEATYQASLERRFVSGFGFAAGADYLKVPAPGGSLGEYKNTQFWGQVSYVPSARFGAQLQYVGASVDRDAFSDDGIVLGERHEGGRGDLQARLFFGGSGDGTGPRLDLAYMRTAFDSAGVLHRIGQAGATASARGTTWGARAAARYSTRWTPLDLSASASWTPAALLTVGAEGVYRTHDGDRTSRWAGVRAGIALPGGFAAAGTARSGEIVPMPALDASGAQDLSELEGSVGWSLRWVGVEASFARTAAFAPVAYQPFPSIPSLAPLPATEWVTVSGRLAPLGGLSVQGSYSNPNVTPDGLPPRHYHVTGTLRSKFLRTFRSGALDLKLELGIEGWESGVIGRDGTGAAIVLPAARFVRSLVRLQIDSFSLFWESRNLGNTATGYVPGLRVPRYSGLFGIRWGFVN